MLFSSSWTKCRPSWPDEPGSRRTRPFVGSRRRWRILWTCPACVRSWGPHRRCSTAPRRGPWRGWSGCWRSWKGWRRKQLDWGYVPSAGIEIPAKVGYNLIRMRWECIVNGVHYALAVEIPLWPGYSHSQHVRRVSLSLSPFSWRIQVDRFSGVVLHFMGSAMIGRLGTLSGTSWYRINTGSTWISRNTDESRNSRVARQRSARKRET